MYVVLMKLLSWRLTQGYRVIDNILTYFELGKSRYLCTIHTYIFMLMTTQSMSFKVKLMPKNSKFEIGKCIQVVNILSGEIEK